MRHHRTFIAIAIVFAVAIASGGVQAQRTHRDSIKFLMTGDSIINQRLSVFTEPAYLDMIRIIRDADFAITNFETLITNEKGYPKAPPAGVYMDSPAYVAKELQWAGIDAVTMANNHASDYGVEGLIESHRALEEAGLPSAGFGFNLGDARTPAYIETGKGRIALIGIASTFDDYIRAGKQGRVVRGRPGINPLRFETEHVVDSAALTSLKELAAKWKLRYRGDANQATFFGEKLVVGTTPGERTRPLKEDLDELVREVREAKRQADWVVVTIHTHEGKDGALDVPADFLVTFARACIDAGADVFSGHGPHVLRGIEIYKGKPIFYSLANFVFQNETVNRLPYEQFEIGGLDDNKSTPADFYDNRSENDKKGFPADPRYWESVIAQPSFVGGELKEVVLYPVDLGYQTSRTQRGRSMLADPVLGKKIIDRLASLSKPFGTEITFDNGVGHVKINRSSN